MDFEIKFIDDKTVIVLSKRGNNDCRRYYEKKFESPFITRLS